MSELQMALIGLGVFLVVAVWGYNLWQDKRHRRLAEHVLPAGQADALMAGRDAESHAAERREPEIAAAATHAVPREPTFAAADADAVETAASAPFRMNAPSDEPRPALAVPAEWADGRADCLLRIEFVDPVSVSALWSEYTAWSHKLDKPVQWLGLDERTARWRNLLPQDPGAVAQVAAALQLVDRKGAVSEESLKTFLQGVHGFAQSFSGLVELPDTAPVLAVADKLDAFCAAVDLQLTLHVLPRQGSLTEMFGAKLKPLIEAGGLKLEGERFVAVDADGVEVFALTCLAVTPFSPAKIEAAGLSDLVFSLDVPRVANGAAAFERMIAFARQCAETLGGQLTDAQHKPLADATIAAIRVRIDDLQGQMAGMNIPAGGVRALRLFS